MDYEKQISNPAKFMEERALNRQFNNGQFSQFEKMANDSLQRDLYAQRLNVDLTEKEKFQEYLKNNSLMNQSIKNSNYLGTACIKESKNKEGTAIDYVGKAINFLADGVDILIDLFTPSQSNSNEGEVKSFKLVMKGSKK